MASTAAVKAPLTDAEAREVKASAEKEYWRGARVRATMWALTFPGHFASINDGKESACVNAGDEMGQVEAREAKARAKELEMRVALSRCRAARAEWLRLQNARTARREHLGVTVSRRVPLAAASSVQVVAAAAPPPQARRSPPHRRLLPVPLPGAKARAAWWQCPHLRGAGVCGVPALGAGACHGAGPDTRRARRSGPGEKEERARHREEEGEAGGRRPAVTRSLRKRAPCLACIGPDGAVLMMSNVAKRSVMVCCCH